MKSIISVILKNNILEHLLFIVLGICASILFKERLIADSGYYVFRVINNETFWVEHNRFILIFSQIFPLIGVKIGLNLKLVLWIYSIGNVIFFYCIFLITRYYYRDEYSGVLLLLLQTLGIMSGFFVPMFELYYSAGLMVLFTTILYCSHKQFNLIILIILSFFILTAHLYSFFLFLFIFILHAEEFRLKYIKVYLLFLVIIIGIFIFKMMTASEYEHGKTNAFINALKYGTYNTLYARSLVAFLWKYYKELLFIELLTLILLVLSKEYMKLIITGLAFIGTLVLINISYPGFEHTRYQEQVYFPLTFMAAYPFVTFIIKSRKNIYRIIFSFIVFLIIVLRIDGIWIDSESFSGRIEEMRSNIEVARVRSGTKFIVNEKNLTYDPNWSYPIETMLLSSFESNKKTITICTDVDIDFNQNKSKLLPDKYLYRRWEIYDIHSLNMKYFKLDSCEYSVLK
jgi:hypothetical protein